MSAASRPAVLSIHWLRNATPRRRVSASGLGRCTSRGRTTHVVRSRPSRVSSCFRKGMSAGSSGERKSSTPSNPHRRIDSRSFRCSWSTLVVQTIRFTPYFITWPCSAAKLAILNKTRLPLQVDQPCSTLAKLEEHLHRHLEYPTTLFLNWPAKVLRRALIQNSVDKIQREPWVSGLENPERMIDEVER